MVDNNATPQQRLAQQQYEFAKDFEDTATGLVVRVNKTSDFRPRYSFEIGRKNRDGRVVRFFPFFVETSNAKVSFTPLHTVSLVALIQAAEGWMREQCQTREYEILADKQRREQAVVDREKPKPKAGLKTLAKRDREARLRNGTPESK